MIDSFAETLQMAFKDLTQGPLPLAHVKTSKYKYIFLDITPSIFKAAMLVLLTFKTPSIEGNCSGNGKL
jgi:hypothetical protein